MNYTLHFQINELPKMANGGHGRWQAEHARRVMWKNKVGYEVIGKEPAAPLKKARVIFTRVSAKEPDFDGLVHGFKPIRDALVLHGILEDDRPSVLQSIYQWEKTKPGSGHIRVFVEEMV